MAKTKYLLHLLEVLTIGTAISTFSFDKQRRVFCNNPQWQRLIRAIYKIIFLPLLLLTLIALGFFIYIVNKAAKKIRKDGEFLSWSGCCSLFVLYLRPLLGSLAICAKHAFNFRFEELERLLNDFVRAYDQYVLLIGNQLHIKWKTFLLLALKHIIIDVIVLYMLYKLQPILAWAYIFLEMQSLMVSQAVVCGLVIVHALFRGAHAAINDPNWPKPKNWQEMEKLVQFSCDVLRLRADFEIYARFTIAWELLLDVALLIFAIAMQSEGYPLLTLLLTPMLMVYPLHLICLTHGIFNIQQHWGNDLLAFDCVKGNAASDELVQMFCIHKLVLFQRSNTSFGFFHLRRSSLLVFFNFAWICAIFVYNNNLQMSDEKNTSFLS